MELNRSLVSARSLHVLGASLPWDLQRCRFPVRHKAAPARAEARALPQQCPSDARPLPPALGGPHHPTVGQDPLQPSRGGAISRAVWQGGRGKSLELGGRHLHRVLGRSPALPQPGAELLSPLQSLPLWPDVTQLLAVSLFLEAWRDQLGWAGGAAAPAAGLDGCWWVWGGFLLSPSLSDAAQAAQPQQRLPDRFSVPVLLVQLAHGHLAAGGLTPWLGQSSSPTIFLFFT